MVTFDTRHLLLNQAALSGSFTVLTSNIPTPSLGGFQCAELSTFIPCFIAANYLDSLFPHRVETETLCYSGWQKLLSEKECSSCVSNFFPQNVL